MLRRLFKEHGVKNAITLFHKPSVPASRRILTLLKQADATVSATATEDQAADHTQQNKAERAEFELDVTEDPPTSDQLRSILEYVGTRSAAKIVTGARDEADAIRKLQQSGESFQRPLVVDWNSGKAVIGDDEPGVLELLKSLRKDQ